MSHQDYEIWELYAKKYYILYIWHNNNNNNNSNVKYR